MFFDGVDDYVFVSPSPSLALSSQFTLMGWFLFPPAVEGGKGFVQKNPQVNDYDYMFYLGLRGFPHVFFKNPAGTGFRAVYPVDYRDGVWHHWCGTFDGRYLRLYTDAVLRATDDTGGQAVRVTGTPLAVGYGWGYYARMYSAQVLIYSRALSDSEILWNYRHPDNPVRSGLVLWFQADPAHIRDIDGDGVLEWVDLSGFGNHGKIYGATLVKLIRDPVR
jgi:hypothetical protein